MTTTVPTDEHEEHFEAVRTLATTRTTDELLHEAMDIGSALLAHYQACIETWGTELAEIVASECGCEGCSRDILDLARDISTAEAEKARVVIAFDVIAELTTGLPAADPEVLVKILDEAQP